MNGELKRLIDQVSREKGIDRQTLIHTLEEAIKSAIKKKYGGKLDLDVTFNEEFGELEAFLFKEVADVVTDPEKQISLEEALQMDPETEVGDELGVRMDTDTLGRIAAQSAKQVIIQKMKDAEREVVYEEFKGRKGDIVNGIVQRADKSGVIVNLGQAEADFARQGTDPQRNLPAGRPDSSVCAGSEENQQGTAGHSESNPSSFPDPAVPFRSAGNRRTVWSASSMPLVSPVHEQRSRSSRKTRMSIR